MAVYNSVINHYFLNAKPLPLLDEQSNKVGVARLGSGLSNGSHIYLQIAVDDAQRIEAISFRVYGCGVTIACLHWLSVALKGLSYQHACTIKGELIVRQLKLPEPKKSCAFLVEDALKAALLDLNRKFSFRGEEPHVYSS